MKEQWGNVSNTIKLKQNPQDYVAILDNAKQVKARDDTVIMALIQEIA